jgi:adenosylhomocysteine nucleosidase
MAGLLIVMALREESQGEFERAGVPVLFTGVGKVNAAHALTRRLVEIRAAGGEMPHVVNFGTAGSNVHPTGTLLCCRAFEQRDMDVTALGFARGVTPYDDSPAVIEHVVAIEGLTRGVCSSADSFETGGHTVAADVMDMEAYALAKVCWLEGARFSSVKYVTDGADHAAAADWRANMGRAAVEFLRVYRQLQK